MKKPPALSTICTSLLALSLGSMAHGQADASLADRAAALTDLRAWMGVAITDVAVNGTDVTLTGTATQAPDVGALDDAARTEAIAFPLSMACNVRALRDLSVEANLTADLSDPFGNPIGRYLIACAPSTTTPAQAEAAATAVVAADAFLAALPDAPFSGNAELLGVATSPGGGVILTVLIPGMATPSTDGGRATIASGYLAEACALPGADALFAQGGTLTIDLFGVQGSIAQLQAASCSDYEIFQ
ncbi:hypothetical protein A8B78_04740 [Jannaschia sp. EhC01]|nr:hypothetical protein A8B78_04740 [Jannaschia sp. EhC01]